MNRQRLLVRIGVFSSCNKPPNDAAYHGSNEGKYAKSQQYPPKWNAAELGLPLFLPRFLAPAPVGIQDARPIRPSRVAPDQSQTGIAVFE